jgi:hypothetical protein
LAAGFGNSKPAARLEWSPFRSAPPERKSFPAPRADFVRQPAILYDFLRLMKASLRPHDRSAIAFISLDVLFGVGFGAIGSFSNVER